MIKNLPDLALEVTAHEPGTIDIELNTAVEAVLTQALRERSRGILVTQHGYDRYTVALSPDVPFGETHERREWDRPAGASIQAEVPEAFAPSAEHFAPAEQAEWPNEQAGQRAA